MYLMSLSGDATWHSHMWRAPQCCSSWTASAANTDWERSWRSRASSALTAVSLLAAALNPKRRAACARAPQTRLIRHATPPESKGRRQQQAPRKAVRCTAGSIEGRFSGTSEKATSPESLSRAACRLERGHLPEDFGIVAVAGASGSGKSRLLRKLARKLPDLPGGEVTWGARMAVVSHPAFVDEETGESLALDFLQCVGFNHVPAWVRPWHVLSQGERSRAELAVRMARAGPGGAVVIDDFAALVDDKNAASMAHSLRKLVSKGRIKHVLLSTTKAAVLPHLAPDFIVYAESGRAAANPWRLKKRVRPQLEGADDLIFVNEGGPGVCGWRSLSGAPSDQDPVTLPRTASQLGAGPRREPCTLRKAAAKYTLKCEVDCDDACREVANLFDFDLDWRQQLFTVRPEVLPRRYALGVMVGPSGSGKSSALARLPGAAAGLRPLSWALEGSVLSQIPVSPAAAKQELLEALAVPPACWERPYHTLSSGEQAAAEAARRLAECCLHEGVPVCLDEFTSSIDRGAAQRLCQGLATLVHSRRAARRPLPPIVIATVHEDVSQWLLPDWVFLASSGRVVVFDGPEPSPDDLACGLHPELDTWSTATENVEEATRALLRPRALQLSVRRLESRKSSVRVFDTLFETHHYMKGKLPPSFHGLLVRCEGVPVAFHAVTCVEKSFIEEGAVVWRESRLVVLPEWQGFGIGPLVSDAVGDRILASKLCFYSKTHHPRMGQYRDRSDRWRATKKNAKPVVSRSGGPPRRPYCHNYYGDTDHGNRHLERLASPAADFIPPAFLVAYMKQYYRHHFDGSVPAEEECVLFKKGVCEFGDKCFFKHGRPRSHRDWGRVQYT